jgi:hypothetical protein
MSNITATGAMKANPENDFNFLSQVSGVVSDVANTSLAVTSKGTEAIADTLDNIDDLIDSAPKSFKGLSKITKGLGIAGQFVNAWTLGTAVGNDKKNNDPYYTQTTKQASTLVSSGIFASALSATAVVSLGALSVVSAPALAIAGGAAFLVGGAIGTDIGASIGDNIVTLRKHFEI